MQVQPYLSFNGRCEEALAFYKNAVAAEVLCMMRFKENPDPQYNPAGMEEKIMHAGFRVGESQLMASDGMCTGQPTKFDGISLSLSVKTVDLAKKYFNALAEGGQVQMPLTEAFFSPGFGLVADKFGVTWMVVVEQPQGI
jgi:PhnB protein